MKLKITIFCVILMMVPISSCRQRDKTSDLKIIFLHHSTGSIIWNGKPPSIITKIASRISNDLADKLSPKAYLPQLIEEYNIENGKNFFIKEITFPKAVPYGWSNFPYDYYNIWVKNAGKSLLWRNPPWRYW